MDETPKNITQRWEFDKKDRGSNRRRLGNNDVTRCPSSDYWWQEQRHISRVFPADSLSESKMNFDKYSYQLYLRPGLPNPEDLKANPFKCKSAYDVKRVAVDRPYGTHRPPCDLHWGQGNKQGVTDHYPTPTDSHASADFTENNCGCAARQPTTDPNPFVHNADSNPTSEQSSSTCVSSATASVSSVSSSSCGRRRGFDDHNNNNNINDNNIDNNNNNNNNEENAFESVEDNECPYCADLGVPPEPCPCRTQTRWPSPTHALDDCGRSSELHHCYSFPPQLGLPAHFRDAKTAPAHSITKETVTRARKEPESSCQAQPMPTIQPCRRCETSPGYGTYQIIGGRQYRDAPEVDPRVGMTLPVQLARYREYQRRCPCPLMGRFDRADPDYDMILPGHKNSTLMHSSPSPFKYMRNPKMNDCVCDCATGSGPYASGPVDLQWAMPTFL